MSYRKDTDIVYCLFVISTEVKDLLKCWYRTISLSYVLDDTTKHV